MCKHSWAWPTSTEGNNFNNKVIEACSEKSLEALLKCLEVLHDGAIVCQKLKEKVLNKNKIKYKLN